MTTIDAELAELAARHGVATEYHDWVGQHVEVAESTVIAVLGALGVRAATAEERRAALAALDRDRWARALPACTVATEGVETVFWAHVRHGDPAQVWVHLEDGTTRDGLRQLDNFTPPFDLDGRQIGEATFAVPTDLPPGYHRIILRSNEFETSAALIVTPSWLGLPARLGARRIWGLATQLYSVRSTRSWGVGDLTDLTDLAVWSASQHGADYVLVNPLHAAAPTRPMEPSPYLPTSRRFANPLYLRVEAIPEFVDLPATERLPGLAEQVRRHATESPQLDRDDAWAAKNTALRTLHQVERSAGRDLAYAAYRDRRGTALDDFATWCALAGVHGADWHRWPSDLRHPRSPQVAEFARTHHEEVDYHRWLQWLLDEQLAAAQTTAVQAGMSLGIMHDLAVGVHPTGADSWALQDVLARGVSVGAPPDEFNQVGQDWSQPPWRPDRLEQQEYLPFRELIAAVLRHAGGVRIDHIIGLFRLWWIPDGGPPTAGTYVRYDHEAMIGIVALEAQRAGAVVVGEDLGTVEPWARDYLRARGILGTSILWFEQDHGAPLPAEHWREYCLSSVTTHDLPPTAGYLAGDHVRLRASLGLLTRSVEDEMRRDRAGQAAWLAELERVGLLSGTEDPVADTESVITALYAYLGRTPSRLVSLALTDAVGDRRTQNQPGTTDEYPNWRIPLSGPDGEALWLEDVFTDRRAAALCDVLRAITR